MSGCTHREGGLKLSRADGEPVDSLLAGRRPPARDVSGQLVPTEELEAAAELSRVARRFRLDTRGIGGFQLYGAYARAARLARVIMRVQ